ncbi:MAG: DUF177 domain-containing protein [Thermodesulfobacteriota bacterium]
MPITDIPAEGREFSFADQSLWTGPAETFSMRLAVAEPLEATLFVIPQKRGAYLRGRLSGTVVLPCDRCAADARVEVDHDFEYVDELPEPGEAAEDTWLREGKAGLELDAAGLLWEQFLLALPTHVLCRPECKGLCASCGADLNVATCDCAPSGGDPRLAALRGLKVGKK